MLVQNVLPSYIVNCRIGSLEIALDGNSASIVVNCRIGSLEMKNQARQYFEAVNCRIGSLETARYYLR